MANQNQSSKSAKKPKSSKTAKRPRTAYILFTTEKRSQVKSENPSLSPKEMMTELAALWKSADSQTKQYYQKLSDAEKEKLKHHFTSSNKENNQSMEVNSSQ